MKTLPIPRRPALVVGHSGLLSGALRLVLEERGDRPFRLLPAGPLALLPLPDLIRELAASLSCWKAADIVVAAGLTNPCLPAQRLREANVAFPLRLRAALCEVPCPSRLVTLGTVMETFPEVAAANAYLASKTDLANSLSGTKSPVPALHLRLHTLYSDRVPPSSHMFLGQLLGALRRDEDFAMSDGRQLREYHHDLDIAESILNMADHQEGGSCEVISSGKPLRLAEIARTAYARLAPHRSVICGSLPTPPGENTEVLFPRSLHLCDRRRPDPLEGILHCLKRHLTPSA